jgi:hypothetical protein
MEIRVGHVISLHKLNINKQDASRGLDLLMGFDDLMMNYEKNVLQIVSALSTELQNEANEAVSMHQKLLVQEEDRHVSLTGIQIAA